MIRVIISYDSLIDLIPHPQLRRRAAEPSLPAVEDPEVLWAAEDDQVPLEGLQHLGQGRPAQGPRVQRHQGWLGDSNSRFNTYRVNFLQDKHLPYKRFLMYLVFRLPGLPDI